MNSTLLIVFILISFCCCGSGKFNIYYNTSVPSDVQAAVVAAVNNIAQYFNLSYDVNVGIQFLSLGNVLADGGTFYYCTHPQYAQMLIPPALYVQFNGTNCFSLPNAIHLAVRINSDSNTDFYTGTDGSKLPFNQNDLVSYIMHVIVQGLGMHSGILNVNGDNAFGNKSLLFDYFVFGSNGIASWPSFNGIVPSPAVTDTSYLTGSKLTFKGNANNSYFPLYTPTSFTYGSSIQHRSTNSLMYWQIIKGQYWHSLDVYLFGMFQSFGYNMVGCSAPNACGNCDSSNPCFSLFSQGNLLNSWIDFF